MHEDVYIGLGSNLGDREKMLREALKGLDVPGDTQVMAISPVYETRAVGGPPDQGDFLNAVAQLATCRSPGPLLELLLDVERALGRKRREKWGPRIIDLDLLLFGQTVIDEPGLTVPHPYLGERRFVLQPLCDLTPQFRHPVTGQTIEKMLQACTDDSRIEQTEREL